MKTMGICVFLQLAAWAKPWAAEEGSLVSRFPPYCRPLLCLSVSTLPGWTHTQSTRRTPCQSGDEAWVEMYFIQSVGFNCASTHSGTVLMDDDGCVSCCQMEPSQILGQARQFLLRTISQTPPTALSSSQHSQVHYVTSDVICKAVHLYF